MDGPAGRNPGDGREVDRAGGLRFHVPYIQQVLVTGSAGRGGDLRGLGSGLALDVLAQGGGLLLRTR